MGNILASLLGIVTPFCSCSAVPLFLGFVEAGVPLGVTFSFLVASPMINAVALVMLWGMFGWKVALLYIGSGLVEAIASGIVIGYLKVVGVLLLDIFKFSLPGVNLSCERQNRMADSGSWGALGLGSLFALSFCPVSAALFFGSLIPLALRTKGGAMLPLFYGLRTGLSVLFFAIAIAFGVKSLNQWFHKLAWLEFYTWRTTGVIFILVGFYYTWMHFINVS